MIDEKRIAEIKARHVEAKSDLIAEYEHGKFLSPRGYESIKESIDDIPYLIGEIDRLKTLAENGLNAMDRGKRLDAAIAGQETLQKEVGRLIDLAGNWKEAADQYHVERNEVQAQLAESRRREQAAVEDLGIAANCETCSRFDNCPYDCEYKPFPGGVSTECFEWRGPQEDNAHER